MHLKKSLLIYSLTFPIVLQSSIALEPTKLDVPNIPKPLATESLSPTLKLFQPQDPFSISKFKNLKLEDQNAVMDITPFLFPFTSLRKERILKTKITDNRALKDSLIFAYQMIESFADPSLLKKICSKNSTRRCNPNQSADHCGEKTFVDMRDYLSREAIIFEEFKQAHLSTLETQMERKLIPVERFKKMKQNLDGIKFQDFFVKDAASCKNDLLKYAGDKKLTYLEQLKNPTINESKKIKMQPATPPAAPKGAASNASGAQ